MKKACRYRYTLLEVVVAMAIFAVGLAVALSVSATSRMRTFKAGNQLKEEHILTQAVEFYMLYPDDESIPEEMFPYPDYEIAVSFHDPEELPEGMEIELGAFKLQIMTVRLYDKNRKLCREISIDRIMPLSGA